MLKLLILVPFLVSTVSSEYGGLFREYREDLNEYLTSEEVDRLVYGNDETVIHDKIKMLPDSNMNPPGLSKHHLPMPTMDPTLDSLGGAPIVKKLPPQRNNFMNIMKTAARMLSNRNANRAPRQRNPTPQFRARPSTLTSSPADPLEVAFKRIEIMASRAGLNMSSMPRRTQMQIIKRLIPKLPPRMAQLMKTTMDHNSGKLFDYLPEPSRDPLVEDNPEFLSHFMDDAKVTMDGADFTLNEHHAFEFVEPTVTHEIVPNQEVAPVNNEAIVITDHQPGTDYSIPTYESPVPSVQPFGFSAPPSFENSPPHQQHTSTFGQPQSHDHVVPAFGQSQSHDHVVPAFGQSQSHDHVVPAFGQSQSHDHAASYEAHNHNVSPDILNAAHTIDLKPIAAPLISETHDIEYQGSENLPIVISSNSPRHPLRSNKALKVTSIKNVTPSTPIIRVSTISKDDIKIQKPIRVSIISKDNITNPFEVNVDPVFSADVVEIKQSEEVKEASAERKTSSEKKVSAEIKSSAEVKTSFADIIASAETKASAEIKASVEGRPTFRTSTARTTTTENTITTSAYTTEEKFIPMPTSVETSPLPNPTSGQLLKEFDDYGEDDQDLTSSELLAELKKYNSDYANSLELDYPLAPHPLEYPDHPDHPDNSEIVLSTATTLTTPRPTVQQQFIPQEQRERERERPYLRPLKPHGGPRPPMRPRIRPPPGHAPPMRPNRPLINVRRPVRPFRPPVRINEVTVSQIPQTIHKECDYFSEDLCLAVQDYPVEAISEALTNKDAANLLVKEPTESSWVDGVGKNQEGGYNFKHYFGDGKVNNGEGGHRHRDFAGEGGFLCPSKVAYGRVKKGKSYTSGEWKYIVNYGDLSQTLRLEKCLSPGNSCSYVLPHYRTACTQVYNYHRLLAWDSEKGLHMDIFKIPTCCTCHVQGYYIPGQQHGITPARRRDIPPKLQYSPQQQRLRPNPQQQQQPQKQVHPPRREPPVQLAQQPTLQAKQQQTKLNDELQDLLTQYSMLRDRIAKKKNERQSVSFSASYSNSTKENSKRESSNQEAPARRPDGKSPMQRLQRQMVVSLIKKWKKTNSTSIKKKLTNLLKAANMTSKPNVNLHPNKASHFNGTAHKIKTGRSLQLERLASLLGILNKNSGSNSTTTVSRPGGRPGGSRRLQGQRSLSQGQEGVPRRRSPTNSSKDKLDKLKMLLSRTLLKHRSRNSNAPTPTSSRSGSPRGPVPNNLKRQYLLQKLNQQRRRNQNRVVKHKLRLKGNKPSKVNYSYHPIMDYFGGTKM